MTTAPRSVARSVARRVSEPVRAPIRQVVNHYANFFEDLIHAVKSEIVGRFDSVDRAIVTGNQRLSDQLGTQAAAIRALQSEMERLQAIVEHQAQEPHLDISDDSEAAARTTTA